jgi:hypothetical protein
MSYVVDDATNSMLYCKLAMYRMYGLSENFWHGMSRHELFHQRSQSCPD